MYHWLPVAELEVKVTEPPAQNVVGAAPALTVGVGGNGFTVTVKAVEAVLGQPVVVLVTTTV
ncbi:hypothetical protein D3C72_2598950 [compost metagenome]